MMVMVVVVRVAICVASRNAGKKRAWWRQWRECQVSVFVCMCSELVGAVEYAVVSRQAGKQARAQSTQASESAPGNGSRESFGWVS